MAFDFCLLDKPGAAAGFIFPNITRLLSANKSGQGDKYVDRITQNWKESKVSAILESLGKHVS